MNRILSLVAVFIPLVGGIAAADPHREAVRGPAHREVVVEHRGPVVRENIAVHGPGVRERENVVVREPGRGGVHETLVIREPDRERMVVRGGPVWHEGVHFRDYRVRPEYRVERFAPVRGFGWHRGDWVWTGGEWFWQPGWYVRID